MRLTRKTNAVRVGEKSLNQRTHKMHSHAHTPTILVLLALTHALTRTHALTHSRTHALTIDRRPFLNKFAQSTLILGGVLSITTKRHTTAHV